MDEIDHLCSSGSLFSLKELPVQSDAIGKAIRSAEAQLAQLTERMDILRTRHGTVNALINTNKNLHNPKSPPQAALYDIFIQFVKDFKGNPWTLAHVCRTWRSLALKSTFLWAGIEIHCSVLRRPVRYRYRDGREVCATLCQLKGALRRAGNSSLDILIYVPSELDDNEIDRRQMTQFWSMMKVFQGPLMQRWGSLEFNGSHESFWEDFFSHPDISLMGLWKLHIHERSPCGHLIDVVARTSHRIDVLDVPIVTQRSLCDSGESLDWMSSLKELSIRPGPTSRHIRSWAEYDRHFVQLVSVCRSLGFLCIHTRDDFDGKLWKDGDYSPFLRRLEIHGKDWTHLASQLPLTHLKVRQEDQGYCVGAVDRALKGCPEPGSILMKDLKDITVVGQCAVWNLISLICPQLERLELKGFKKQSFEILTNHLRRCASEDKFKQGKFELKELLLENIDITTMKALLEVLPTIEVLIIRVVDSSFDNMQGIRKQLLPNLRTFKLVKLPPPKRPFGW